MTIPTTTTICINEIADCVATGILLNGQTQESTPFEIEYDINDIEPSCLLNGLNDDDVVLEIEEGKIWAYFTITSEPEHKLGLAMRLMNVHGHSVHKVLKG